MGCVDKKVVIGIPIEDYYFALSLQCASTKKGRAADYTALKHEQSHFHITAVLKRTDISSKQIILASKHSASNLQSSTSLFIITPGLNVLQHLAKWAI